MGLNVPAGDSHQGVLAGPEIPGMRNNLKVKTAADVRSRRFVIRDTTDQEIKVAGAADEANGLRGIVEKKLLGGEIKGKAADGTTADDFAAADLVSVIHEGEVIAVLDASQTIVAGDLLSLAAKGRVKKRAAEAAGVPTHVAVARESVTTGAAEFKLIRVKLNSGAMA